MLLRPRGSLMTHCGHKPDRNPAAQQRPAVSPQRAILCRAGAALQLYSEHSSLHATGLSSGGRFGSPIRARVASCTSACLRSLAALGPGVILCVAGAAWTKDEEEPWSGFCVADGCLPH